MDNNKIICHENGYGVIFNDFMSLKDWLELTEINKEINSIDDIKCLYSQNNEDIKITTQYRAIIKCHDNGIYKEYKFSDWDIVKKVYNNLKYNSNIDDVELYQYDFFDSNPNMVCFCRAKNNKNTKLFLKFLNRLKKIKMYKIDNTILKFNDDDNRFYINYGKFDKKVAISEIMHAINFKASHSSLVRKQLQSNFGWDLISYLADYH